MNDKPLPADDVVERVITTVIKHCIATPHGIGRATDGVLEMEIGKIIRGNSSNNELEKLIAFFREPDAYSRFGWAGDQALRSPVETAIYELRNYLSSANLLRQSEQVGGFQPRVKPWMDACFGPEISADKVERNHRFLEEALELVQACGCTQSEAHQLVDYVYGRDQGDINQEIGGVMVTLAALCLANGFDMHSAGETELARIWTKIEKIREKQASKPKNSPLPASPPADVAGMREACAKLCDDRAAENKASFSRALKTCSDFLAAECRAAQDELEALAIAIRALPIPESKTDAAVKALVAAAREFVRKVEAGEARSKVSYGAFKAALYELDSK